MTQNQSLDQAKEEVLNKLHHQMENLYQNLDQEDPKDWGAVGSLQYISGQLEQLDRSWSSMHNRPAGE